MDSRAYFLAILLYFFSAKSTSGSEVLMWMSYGTKSHVEIWSPLIKALTSKGHSVTFVTAVANPELNNRPNVNQISLDYDVNSRANASLVFESEFGACDTEVSNYVDAVNEGQRRAFEHPEITEMIEAKKHFDVAILTPNAADIGFHLAKHVFKAPIVQFFPGTRFPSLDIAVGNPTNPSYIPNDAFGPFQKMGYWNRVWNTFGRLSWTAYEALDIAPGISAGLRQLMNITENPLDIFYSDTAFALYNNHPVFESVVPTTANSALVGGMHLRPAEDLRHGVLRKKMDKAEAGIVFVHFDSDVKGGNTLPKEKERIFVNVFTNLKHLLVVWQTNDSVDLKDATNIILVDENVSRQDILGHNNVKLFILDGSLSAVQESIYHKVPMVVIPGHDEQFSLADLVDYKGIGVSMKWPSLDVKSLWMTIRKVVGGGSLYWNRVSKMGTILADRMVSPLEEAVFHVEYVIRHNGAEHLRSPALDLEWYELYLLDVAAFFGALVLVLSAVLFAGIALFQFACRKVTSRWGVWTNLCNKRDAAAAAEKKKKN